MLPSVDQCKKKMMKMVQKFINPDAADDETFAELDASKPYYLQVNLRQKKRNIFDLQIYGHD